MFMRARLSFQNLNTFASAAQALSFQRAAEDLGVTPSAVSHQIRGLESLLGYALFERLDKQVRLTSRGRQLYLEIREPLRQLHEASSRALAGPEDNALALSVAPVFATRWLLPRLKDFHARCPEVNLSVVATTSLVDLRNDPFDAAIRMGGGRWPAMSSVRLFDRRIVAVCRPDLLVANGGSFTMEQLAGQSLIHNASMSGLWPEWFESAGVAPAGTLTGMEVQNSAQVLEAVSAGDAIGLVDLNFIRDDLQQGRLALASDHVLSGADGYFLTYPEAGRKPTALQLFEQWLASQVDVG